MFSYFSRCIVREKSNPFLLLLGELPPSTGQIAGDKCPNNWGLMDKEAARCYLEAWIKEPMMKPRRVVYGLGCVLG